MLKHNSVYEMDAKGMKENKTLLWNIKIYMFQSEVKWPIKQNYFYCSPGTNLWSQEDVFLCYPTGHTSGSLYLRRVTAKGTLGPFLQVTGFVSILFSHKRSSLFKSSGSI